MSNNTTSTPAEILILSAVKSVGKREFLKTVERIFKTQPVKEKRQRVQVLVGEQCVARVKGDRTGLKVGRNVVFDNCRCERRADDSDMCAIHKNQLEKFGSLPYGKHGDPLTDEQKKVFGEV